MNQPLEVVQPHVLVVEGKEEELFFGALLMNLSIGNVQILPIGGKTRLGDNLAALVRTPGFTDARALAVVRDADGGPSAAFQSVCDHFRNAGLNAPRAPFVIEPGTPSTAVVILPDATRTGMLEDLCLEAVSADPSMRCVDDFLACLNTVGSAMPSPVQKAKMQAFLASRREPGKRLGEAAEAGYFPWSSPAFSSVGNFLASLSAT